MKKIICLFVAVIMSAIAISVNASSEPSVDFSSSLILEGGKNVTYVTIEGNLPGYANEKALVKILREGIDENSDELSYMQKYAYVNTVWTDSEGKFSLSFPFTEDSAEYTVKVISDTMDNAVYATLFIQSTVKIDEILYGLENGTHTKETLTEALNGCVAEFGLYDGFLNFGKSTKESIAQYVIDNIEEFSFDALKTVYSEAVLINGIAPGVSDEIAWDILDSCINVTNIKENAHYVEFEKLSAESAKNVVSYMTLDTYSDINDVENGFYKALSLKLLNDISSYNQIDDIIAVYSAYHNDVSFDKYEALSASMKDKVNLKLASVVKKADDYEELYNGIEKAISAVKNEGSSGGSSGSSGGGGGGSSGGYSPVASTPVVSLDEIEKEDASVFGDVLRTHWAYEAVISLFNKGIIAGKSNGIYAPDDKITRAEFAKLMVTAYKLPSKEVELTFGDVSSEDWYYEYVKTAVANGIINGMDENTFAPVNNISRQDAAVMLARAIGAEGEVSASTFSDDEMISEYAKQSVYFLRSKKIVNGSGNVFNPVSNLTRAEAAVMIYNALNSDN